MSNRLFCFREILSLKTIIKGKRSMTDKGDDTEANKQINLKVTEKDQECSVCQKIYELEDCTDFLKLSVEEGLKIFFGKNLYSGCYQRLSETINVKRCRDKEICRVYCVKYPTPLHDSKASSRKKSANEYIKEDKKTSSAPANSVNMGLNVIGMSLLRLDQKKLINLFIARPCLTTAAKAHLSQRVLWKNCE